MNMDIAVFPNRDKESVYPFFRKLREIFEERHISYYLPDYVRPDFEKRGIHLDLDHYASVPWIGDHVRYVLSCGGDGSFLGVARLLSAYPVLLAGIHLGDLGFLNSISPDEVDMRLSQIEKEDYDIEHRIFLSSYILDRDGKKTVLPDVLNDIVVGHGEIGKMVRLHLWINGRYTQTYPADGLVISTPTGSTSYSLSCGGPILHCGAKNIIVVPICPHMMRNIPMVLSASDEVKITLPSREEGVEMSLDGSSTWALSNESSLCIHGLEKKIRFIRFRDQDFFSTLCSKFNKRNS